jgi:aldehyde:ferredoxin oxidoreductase
MLAAADYIGRGAPQLLSQSGIATKAGETKDYDPRLIYANALIYATEPRRPIQLLHAIAIPLRRWVNWYNKLDDAFLSTAVFQDIAEKYWGGPAAVDFSSYEGKALAAKMIQDYGYAKESLILCDTLWPIHQVRFNDPDIRAGTLESRILHAITGNELDEAELMKTGERVFNLQRAILIRDGWGGRREMYFGLLFEEPLDSVYWSPECIVPGENGQVVSRKGAIVDRTEFEKMKDEYYSLRGWDVESGRPTVRKLEELGLHDIAGVLKSLPH